MQDMQADTAELERWWSTDSVALVTGANKGLGLQLVREFAKRGFTTILTSRNEENGKSAVELLKSEGTFNVVFHQLDVESTESVEQLAQWLTQSFSGIDVLVNNAAITSLSFVTLSCTAPAQKVIETNYYGTKKVIEAMSPLMKPGGRIINVCSKTGDTSYLQNEWKIKLSDENISALTPEAIDEFTQSFLGAVDRGDIEAGGWPCIGAQLGLEPEKLSDYATSKIALAAYSRIIAPKLKSVNNISVNCMCPGATNTSMTGFRGHPVEAGADTAVWLALLPASKTPTGKFFVGRKDVGFSNIPLNINGFLSYQLNEVLKLEIDRKTDLTV